MQNDKRQKRQEMKEKRRIREQDTQLLSTTKKQKIKAF